MTYIEGFVIAVPTANKQAFIDHGATRVVETWQDHVEKGRHTDFFGAVDAQEDEAVAFAWIEWPDRAARQAVMTRTDELAKGAERFIPESHPAPFDAKRMIFGGFKPAVDLS
jgi:uncharacterized protein YbaA (DUF1428 family)